MRAKLYIITIIIYITGCISITGCAGNRNPEEQSTKDISSLTADNNNAVSSDLDSLNKLLRQYPVDACVVQKEGEIIYEYYTDSFHIDTPHRVYSITKSVTSALLGIAIENGYISGLDSKLSHYFPEILDDSDPRKGEITIGHLLSMTSGFDWNEWGNDIEMFRLWESSKDRIGFVLEADMKTSPGEEFNYNTGGFHLLSAVIQDATDKSLLEYSNETLFGALDIKDVIWDMDPSGINTGGNGLYLTAADALKLGQLYLQNGEWNGTQVISQEWIKKTTTMQMDNYGYGWWTNQEDETMYYALGFGGQYLIIIPEQQLVAVVFGRSWTGSYPDIFELLFQYF